MIGVVNQRIIIRSDSKLVCLSMELELEKATDRIGSFLERAKEAGVQRLVLLTGRGEDEGLRQEALVRDSGLAWTVVRSAWFNQNFTEGGFAELVEAGQFVLPAGHVPEPFVDLDDVADVAVAALTQPGHHGEIYEVTGPRGLTLEAVAAELSQALGRPIPFVPVTHDDFLAGLEAAGVPDDEVGLLDFLFGTLLDGRNAHLGDGVQRALGREPMDFSDFARKAAADSERNSPLSPSAKHEEVLRRFVSDFINGGDEAVLPDLIHDDYVYASPGEELKGRRELAAMFRGLRSAFPDMELTSHRVIATDDTTVMDFTLTGTHRGDFMGIPATHRRIDIRGVVISRYRDGRIAQEWEILDTLTMLQQLEVA